MNNIHINLVEVLTDAEAKEIKNVKINNISIINTAYKGQAEAEKIKHIAKVKRDDLKANQEIIIL